MLDTSAARALTSQRARHPSVLFDDDDYSVADAAQVATALGADLENGLTAREASRRLVQNGRNELRAAPRIPGWRRFLSHFQDPLVYRVLVFWSKAAKLSEWVQREWRFAFSLGKRIVPTLLDKAPLPPELLEFQAVKRFRSRGLLWLSGLMLLMAIALSALFAARPPTSDPPVPIVEVPERGDLAIAQDRLQEAEHELRVRTKAMKPPLSPSQQEELGRLQAMVQVRQQEVLVAQLLERQAAVHRSPSPQPFALSGWIWTLVAGLALSSLWPFLPGSKAVRSKTLIAQVFAT